MYEPVRVFEPRVVADDEEDDDEFNGYVFFTAPKRRGKGRSVCKYLGVVIIRVVCGVCAGWRYKASSTCKLTSLQARAVFKFCAKFLFCIVTIYVHGFCIFIRGLQGV